MRSAASTVVRMLLVCLTVAVIAGGLIAWASRATPGLRRTRLEGATFLSGLALAVSGIVAAGLWN